ncbi:S41 family peptidase [Marinococcus halophilus]|uniref:S41 family peptidase n=1 Tax=Marinococcus halophilus TaxID=1371 RepID=UPI003614835F
MVEIEDREGTISEVTSSLEENKDYPVVGVIDQGSVSASEILAAAMKESGGFELVGQTTYGKGTVQQVMELDDGSDVKLSVSKWLTPDGNWINEEGVKPTIEQEQPDYFQASILSIDEALEPDTTGENIATAQTLLKGAGFDPGREDGYYSKETEAAVQDFQEEQKDLEATGTLTPETADALNDFVLENVQNRDNDKQLQRALDTVTEQ